MPSTHTLVVVDLDPGIPRTFPAKHICAQGPGQTRESVT